MGATLSTGITGSIIPTVTSAYTPNNSSSSPCIVQVAIKPAPVIQVAIKQSVTAAEVITAFNTSGSSTGFAGKVVTKKLYKNNIGNYIVPSNIYGDLILNTVIVSLEVPGILGSVTLSEMLVDITYDPETFALIIPENDMQYLEDIGIITSITVSYIEKVSSSHG